MTRVWLSIRLLRQERRAAGDINRRQEGYLWCACVGIGLCGAVIIVVIPQFVAVHIFQSRCLGTGAKVPGLIGPSISL